MKIIYFISIFLFLAIVLRGQSPTFAPIGSRWGYTYSDQSSRGDYMKEAVSDTLIKGRICRKIKITSKLMFCVPMCGPVTTSTYFTFIAQSQDSVFTSNASGDKLEFLYHFNARVGDTMAVPSNRSATNLKYLCTRLVDTIFGGVTLKKWQFKSICDRPNSSDYPIILLEKVGALKRPFNMESTCVIDEFGYGLCSFKSDNVNFQSPNCITSTVENTLSDAVQISPNPAHTYLNVASNHPFVTTKIVDMTGKILKIRSYTEGSSLDISDLPTGIFLLQLMDDKGRTAVKRFVKL